MKYAFDKIPDFLPTPFDHEDAKEVHGFRGKPADKIWYGVELELEFKKRLYLANKEMDVLEYYDNNPYSEFAIGVDHLNSQVNKFAIIKYDGSLTEGVEIATAPCSFEIQLDQFQKFYTILPTLPFESRKSCGMHVHVSKKHFTDEQIQNVRDFVAKRSHRSFFIKIAGRGGSKYCCYTYNGEKEHYDAVNLENKSTIEFRLFRAPASFDEFATSLEFVKAVIEFARSESFQNDLTTFQKFVKQRKFGRLQTFCKANKDGDSDRTGATESQKLAHKLKKPSPKIKIQDCQVLVAS